MECKTVNLASHENYTMSAEIKTDVVLTRKDWFYKQTQGHHKKSFYEFNEIDIVTIWRICFEQSLWKKHLHYILYYLHVILSFIHDFLKTKFPKINLSFIQFLSYISNHFVTVTLSSCWFPPSLCVGKLWFTRVGGGDTDRRWEPSAFLTPATFCKSPACLYSGRVETCYYN